MRIGELTDADFIGYLPEEDQLGISFFHIAAQSARYDTPETLFIDPHLPRGQGVRAEDHTVLQAIEEAFHRYQIKVLGYEPESTKYVIKHPLEDGIIPVFEEAVRDLGITLYPLNRT